MIGFWTLIVFYSHIGAHHILQAPIPNSLKAVSIADSLAMVIPVFTVAGESVADGARPRRGVAPTSGGPVRSGRDDLVSADLHPGTAAIDAQPCRR